LSGVTGIIDLTRDLATAARMGASTEAVDALLGESLAALGTLVPYDLATILEIDGDELRVRIASGPLAGPEVRRHRLSLASFPSLREALRDGRARTFTEHDHRDGDGDTFDGVLDLPDGHSCMVVPLSGRDAPLGLLSLDRETCGVYPPDVVEVADVFGRLLGMAMSYGEQSALLGRLHEQLQEQNRLLVERSTDRSDACSMIDACRSPAMLHVARLAKQVAATDTPVLITGDTGTGKEVLASAIHGWSARHSRPLVSINCAALPPGLIESELFGHVKGAFSGAVGRRMGRFQAANGGTLLLDEVGELPLDLQAKLLRALQEGTFEPVGSVRFTLSISCCTSS
jgi:transcriptional regulator with GAF, ATPase, and Fis domain